MVSVVASTDVIKLVPVGCAALEPVVPGSGGVLPNSTEESEVLDSMRLGSDIFMGTAAVASVGRGLEVAEFVFSTGGGLEVVEGFTPADSGLVVVESVVSAC